MFDLAGGMVGSPWMAPTAGASVCLLPSPRTRVEEAECAPQERRAEEGSEGNITQDETGT